MNIESIVTRRDVLLTALALPALLQTACGEPGRQDFLTTAPSKTFTLDNKGPTQQRSLPGNLDPSYVDQLIKILSEDRADKDSRVQAVKDNLSWKEVRGSGSSLMIDESGYFLANAHSFGTLQKEGGFQPYNELSLIYHPRTGILTPIRNFIVHLDYDLSIFFAPTGKPKQPVPNLQLRLNLPTDKERLWMFGLFTDKNNKVHLDVLHGRVNSDLPLSLDTYKSLTVVEGMVPYAGTSGAPVLDAEGKVLAIESGTWPQNAKDYKEYKGAVVAPLKDLEQFIQSPKIHTLPLR